MKSIMIHWTPYLSFLLASFCVSKSECALQENAVSTINTFFPEVLDRNLDDFQPLMTSLVPREHENKINQLDFGIWENLIRKNGLKSRAPRSGADDDGTSDVGTAGDMKNSNNLNTSLKRILPEKDFQDFRDLFQSAIIRLPDFEASDNIGFVNMQVTVTNILCREILLGDILINYNRESNQKLTFEVDIRDIDLVCDMDFGWSFGMLSDGGQASVRTVDSSAKSAITFTSEDFNLYAPHSSEVEHCSTEISISDLQFTGSVTAAILSVFESIINGRIEQEVSEITCSELTSLGTTFIGDVLKLAEEFLAGYTEPLDAWRLNPIHPEKLVTVPDGVQLLNFNNPVGIGKLFVTIMNQLNFHFSSWSDVPQGAAIAKDLGINIFLRENVLDDNGAFTINIDTLPISFNPKLFEGHDRLTETTITLNCINVFGLDSFTRFEPAYAGNHTYQAFLHWESLRIEADATVHIQPSTLEDSLLENPEPIHILENIKIDLGLDDLDASVAMLLAIDQLELEQLEIGSLFFQQNIFQCLMSTFRDIGISGMDISVRNIREPTLNGFVSPGIDRVVTRSVEAAFQMYERVVIDSIPSIFQTTVRDLITVSLIDLSLEARCNSAAIVDEFIDFRDLLLEPDASVALGGFGDERYGDTVVDILGVIRDQFQENSDGSLKINSVIRGLTGSQSGVEGMLRFVSDIFAISVDHLPFNFMESLDIKLSDARIRNIDTLGPPTALLQPTADPHFLSNRIHLGANAAGRPLNTTILLGLMMNNSNADMVTEIDVSASFSVDLMTDIFAMIDSQKLLRFHFNDITNLHCWLTIIDENGIKIKEDNNPNNAYGLSVDSFLTRIAEFQVDANCRNCENTGVFSFLPKFTGVLNQLEVAETLDSRIGILLEELVMGDPTQNLLNQLVKEAGRFCPSSADYNPDTTIESRPPILWPTFAWSAEAIDTIVFSGIAMAQLGFAFLAETLIDWSTIETFDVLLEHELFPYDGMRLLDWTSLSESASPVLNFVFTEARSYLKSRLDVDLTRSSQRSLDETFTEDGFGSPSSTASASFFGPSSTTSASFLGVEGMVAELVGNDGRLTIPIENFQYENAGFLIRVHSVKIAGLDSYREFNFLDPVAPQTLLSTIDLETLGIEIDISVDSVLSAGEAIQNFIVSLDAGDINILLPLHVALDLDLFDALELGSFLSVKGILPCFLSTINSIEIPEISARIGTLRGEVIGLMPETAKIVSNLTSVLFENFGSIGVEKFVASLLDAFVRPLVNDQISSFIARSSCENPLATSSTHNYDTDIIDDNNTRTLNYTETVNRYIDFRDLLLSEQDAIAYGGDGDSRYGDTFRSLFRMLQKVLLQVDEHAGLSVVNGILSSVISTKTGQTGMLQFDGDILSNRVKIDVGEFDAEVGWRLFNASIENINQIGAPFSIMHPVPEEPHKLNNTATLGASRAPLRLSARFLIEFLQDDGVQISNDVKLSADFHALTIALITLVKISEERFANFQIRDLLNPHCWLATIPARAIDSNGVRLKALDTSAAITYLAASVERMNLTLDCVSCSGSGMQDLAVTLNTPSAGDEVTSTVNKVLHYVAGRLGGDFAQVQIDRLLHEAPKHCPHRPQYESNPQPIVYEPFHREVPDQSVSDIITLVALTTSLLCCIAVVAIVVRWIVRRRSKKWLMSLSGRRLSAVLKHQKLEQLKESELNVMTKSIFRSSAISIYVRCLIPLVIIGNIGLFLSGHLSLGATINIEGEIAGDHFVVEKFFEFSMARSTLDIWNAGGKALAILIIIFSGIWPYTKQLVTLVIWFLPPTFLSISTRGSTLSWLDALAKWSMVDIFTLLVTIAAFRVSVVSPGISFLPENFYSIHLMVVPMWGLYANMIAQLVSQISSHFIIHYHRLVVRQATERYNNRQNREELCGAFARDFLSSKDGSPGASIVNSGDENGALVAWAHALSIPDKSAKEPKDRLCSYEFTRPHRGECEKLIVRHPTNYLVFFVSLLLSILLILGCTFPTFSVEVLGIVGLFVESGQEFEPAVTDHSVFSIVHFMMDQAKLAGSAGSYFGLGILSALCIFCVMIVPLVQTIALLVQWLSPMTIDDRSKLGVVVETLQAWQYAEVYIISVVVASWQLGPISDFMINAYCDSLTDTLTVLQYYGILEKRDAQCFQVQASMENGTYMILVSAIFLGLLNTFVTKATLQYFRDKDAATSPASLPEEGLPPVEGETWENAFDGMDAVKTVPVLFTDSFRWLLHGKADTTISQTYRILNADAKQVSFTDIEISSGGRSSTDYDQPSNGLLGFAAYHEEFEPRQAVTKTKIVNMPLLFEKEDSRLLNEFSSTSRNSFLLAADGNGSVAEAIGETLDKCAKAINDMVNEMNRSSEARDDTSVSTGGDLLSEQSFKDET